VSKLETLLRLLELVGHGNDTILLSEEELARWDANALQQLKAQKLLKGASPAVSLVCPGCERECAMPVHIVPNGGVGKSVSFVVCDKRDDINRVPISMERVRQWRCDVEAIGAFIAQSLELLPGSQRKAAPGQWELGVMKGKQHNQMLCLRTTAALQVVAGSSIVPLAELACSVDGSYRVDAEAVSRLVDAAAMSDPRYTPSDTRREARKAKTASMRESWQKAYRALRRHRPDMSDVWYSQQIAKLDIAEGRNAETIRKHMKR
jgi:hypothetical protein